MTANETSVNEPPVRTRDIDLTPLQRKVTRRAVAGSAIGNATEWFDYGVYGYLVVYVSKLFFTFGDDTGSLPLVLAFATFAVSFLVRPLGGVILGPLGDRIGRHKILVFTILMMSVSTALIGVLPVFDTIGVWAPVLLVLLRMIQGFSAGGEYAGAAVFMAEHAPDDRRGFYGSFLEFGTLTGFSGAAVLCTVMTLIVGDDGMMAGWWRLPFLLTLVLGLVGLWMRTSLHESDTFTADSQHTDVNKSALRALGTLLRQYPLQVLKLFGFVILLNTAFYLVLTYMPSYLSATLGHGVALSNITLVIIQLIMVVVIVPFGALSDKIGRKPLLITASIGFTVLSVPAVMLIQVPQFWAQLAGIGMLGLFLVILESSISATLPALFPTAVRYSGFAIGYNLSTAIFGGTAAMITTALVGATGNVLIPGWYLAIAGLIGLVSVLSFKETAGRSLRGNIVPGEDDAVRAERGETLVGARRR